MWQLHALVARDLLAERRREADAQRLVNQARRRADQRRAAEPRTGIIRATSVPAGEG